MKKSLVTAAALAFAAIGAPANAADLPLKAPPMVYAPPISDWSGFYIGLHGGYGWGRDPFDEEIFVLLDFDGIRSRGWVFGGQAGYNWQSGLWVGGLEIDLSGTGIKGSNSKFIPEFELQVPNPNPCPACTSTETLSGSRDDRFDLLGTARARLGILPFPSLLLYGTGGLAWTRFVEGLNASVTITTTDNSGTTPVVTSNTVTITSSTPTWRFGWVAGAGAEVKIFESNWLARVEYLHYDFLNSGSASTNVPGSLNLTSGHLTADVVRAGLSYKFSALR